MKTRTFIFTAVLGTVLSFGFSACSQGEKSLFGGIPSIYEDQMMDVVSDMKDLMKDHDEGKEIDEARALSLYTDFSKAMDKASEKAKPLADKMVGKSLPYTQEDSLPYKIVSDILVKEVSLPEMSILGNSTKELRMKVEFDVVFTEDQDSPIRICYFMMSGEQPVAYDYLKRYESKHVGDTLHLETNIVAPDIPSEYLESCDELRFVTYGNFKANRENIKKQQEEWNKAFAKKLGLSGE